MSAEDIKKSPFPVNPGKSSSSKDILIKAIFRLPTTSAWIVLIVINKETAALMQLVRFISNSKS